jgi:hypothetical protein
VLQVVEESAMPTLSQPSVISLENRILPPEGCQNADQSVIENNDNTNSEIDSSPWASVDVPGSPRLSRLLDALRIHKPSNIEPLTLSELPNIPIEDTSEYLETSVLIDKVRTQSIILDSDSSSLANSNNLVHTSRRASRSFESPPLKYRGVDIFFPSGHWISPSPFGELYPFPTSTQYSSRRPIPSAQSDLNALALTERANRLQTFLATFKKESTKSNSVMLKSMEHLAGVLQDLGRSTQSEIWREKVVALHKNSKEANTPEEISAMLQLLKIKGALLTEPLENKESRRQEYEALENELQSLVSQVPSRHVGLELEFLRIKATRLENIKQTTKQEALLRQMLQICLTHRGPKHANSINAIGKLGKSFALTVLFNPKASVNPNLANASVNLTRAAIQMHMESTDILQGNGQYLIDYLQYSLRATKHYEDAINFGQEIMKRSKLVLGENHVQTLRYAAELGATYREAGRLSESVATLQYLLQMQDKDNTDEMDAVWRIQELGLALRELRDYDQAIAHLKKAFTSYLAMWGPLDGEVKMDCWALGDCYTQLGQHQDAIDLYTRYTRELRDAGNAEHPWMLEAQGWLDDLNRYLLKNKTGNMGDAESLERITPM